MLFVAFECDEREWKVRPIWERKKIHAADLMLARNSHQHHTKMPRSPAFVCELHKFKPLPNVRGRPALMGAKCRLTLIGAGQPQVHFSLSLSH